MPGFAFAIARLGAGGAGAGREKRAAGGADSGWASAWQACAVMTTMAIVFFVFAEYFARLFTSDPKVIEAGGRVPANQRGSPSRCWRSGWYWRARCRAQATSLKAMLATFVTQWVVRIPLAYLMAFWLGWDAYGAWGAMALGSGFSER